MYLTVSGREGVVMATHVRITSILSIPEVERGCDEVDVTRRPNARRRNKGLSSRRDRLAAAAPRGPLASEDTRPALIRTAASEIDSSCSARISRSHCVPYVKTLTILISVRCVCIGLSPYCTTTSLVPI